MGAGEQDHAAQARRLEHRLADIVAEDDVAVGARLGGQLKDLVVTVEAQQRYSGLGFVEHEAFAAGGDEVGDDGCVIIAAAIRGLLAEHRLAQGPHDLGVRRTCGHYAHYHACCQDQRR